MALNGNIETPLARIGITDEMRQLNGRIIRCSFEEGQWKFLSGSRRCYPNSHRTIQGKCYNKLYYIIHMIFYIVIHFTLYSVNFMSYTLTI